MAIKDDKRTFCQLWLTCANKEEADKIAKNLLEKKLIACARQIPVSSDFRWQAKMEHDDEILLLMESTIDLFDEIEAEITKLHSYDTFVLEATPIALVSKSAEKWLRMELKDV